MEKRTPHCPLERVWALIAAGRIRTTSTALQGAQAFGMDYPCMLEVIMSLKRTVFHKSMTAMSITEFGRMCIVHRLHGEAFTSSCP